VGGYRLLGDEGRTAVHDKIVGKTAPKADILCPRQNDSWPSDVAVMGRREEHRRQLIQEARDRDRQESEEFAERHRREIEQQSGTLHNPPGPSPTEELRQEPRSSWRELLEAESLKGQQAIGDLEGHETDSEQADKESILRDTPHSPLAPHHPRQDLITSHFKSGMPRQKLGDLGKLFTGALRPSQR